MLIVATAFPFRIRAGALPVGSFTVLDLLFFGLLPWVTWKSIRVGDRAVFAILSTPLVVCAASLLWSQDPPSTLRELIIYFECMMAYLVAIRCYSGMAPFSILNRVGVLMVLVLVGSVLSLMGVPGFEPPTYGMEPGTTEYIAYITSYFTRLSHPFVGPSNDFASMLAFFPLLFLMFALDFKKRRYGWLVGLLILSVLLTVSRGTIVALLAGAIGYLWVNRRHAKQLLLAAVVLGALGTVATTAFLGDNSDYAALVESRQRMDNLDIRWGKIDLAFAKIIAAPLVGYGAGVVPDGQELLKGGVHNTYLQQVVSYGIPVGMTLGLGFILLALRFLNWQSANPLKTRTARTIGLCVIVQLLIFVSETSFEAAILRVYFYYFLGISVALVHSLKDADQDGHRVVLREGCPA